MIHARNVTAHGQCERSRRSEGFPAQRLCTVCHLGPCVLGIGEPSPDLYYLNRLHGVAINDRGEAI